MVSGQKLKKAGPELNYNMERLLRTPKQKPDDKLCYGDVRLQRTLLVTKYNNEIFDDQKIFIIFKWEGMIFSIAVNLPKNLTSQQYFLPKFVAYLHLNIRRNSV